MKKLTLLIIMIASLTLTNEVYAQGNSGKDKPERDKPERDKPERDKPERDKPEKKTHEKNIKAEDAQKNWGKLKGEYEDLSKSEQKEKKEEIKAKKRIRKEVRKEIEKNPDLDLSLIPEYNSDYPNDLEKLVEKLFDDYSGAELNVETVTALEAAGMSEISINKIENSLLKYNEKLNIPTKDLNETETAMETETEIETETSSEDTEKIEI